MTNPKDSESLVEKLRSPWHHGDCNRAADVIERLTNELDALRAELARKSAPGWLPIESAPKEGQFLVYMPTDKRHPIQVADWHPNVKVIGSVFHFDAEPITHWLPLPAAPDDSTGG